MHTDKVKIPSPDGKSPPRPETAPWKVKGDGVAYTTAKEIFSSEAGRRSIAEAAKVQLNR